ncbi:hypothetical protein Tco_0139380, partial [Tanacetum coccineum]
MAWSVHEEILSATRRSANKYIVLEMYEFNEQGKLNVMRNSKLRNEELVDKGKASSVQSKQIIEEDDVFQDDSGMARCIEGDEIIGMDKG